VADLDELLDRYAPKPLRILFFDVESAPMLAYIWQAKTEYVNPDAILHETFLLCWAAKWAGDDRILHARLTSKEAKAQDDSRIVEKLATLIRQADVVVAHNGDRFDMPKLNTRLALHQGQPLGAVQTIDTLKLARSAFRFASNRLDYLAQKLGVGAKLHTTFSLWKRAYAGEAAALRDMDVYCRQDVVVLEAVFEAIRPYVKRLPRLVDAGQYGQKVCPNCGSNGLQPDGVHRTNANTYARFRCDRCGRRCRSFRQKDAPKLEMRPV
jgi:hypothetical protein